MSEIPADILQERIYRLNETPMNLLEVLNSFLSKIAAGKWSKSSIAYSIVTFSLIDLDLDRDIFAKKWKNLVFLLKTFQFDFEDAYKNSLYSRMHFASKVFQNSLFLEEGEKLCFSLCRAQLARICFALQPLHLPAWCTVLILLEQEDENLTGELARRSRLYHIWSLVTKIKHFKM